MASEADEAEVEHDAPAAEGAGEPEPGCCLIETSVPRLHYKGCKKYWSVTESEFIDVGGNQFIKLPQGAMNHGFARLCGEYMYRNEKIPEKFSLALSNGYELVKDLRNKAQSASLMQERLKSVPKWQQATINVKPEKRSRLQLKEEAQNRQSIEVTLPPVDGLKERVIRVVRPVLGNEELAVEYSVETIDHIVRIIDTEGFEETRKRKARNPDLLPGVYSRKLSKGSGEFYIVPTPKSSKRKSKVVYSKGEANLIAEQGYDSPTENVDDENEPLDANSVDP